jgi:hypothetical protein
MKLPIVVPYRRLARPTGYWQQIVEPPAAVADPLLEIVAAHCAFPTGTLKSDKTPTGLDSVQYVLPLTTHTPMSFAKPKPHAGSEDDVGHVFAAWLANPAVVPHTPFCVTLQPQAQERESLTWEYQVALCPP